jgi:hypothetical protein
MALHLFRESCIARTPALRNHPPNCFVGPAPWHNRISLNKMCNLQTFTIFCFGSTIIWNIMIIFKECVALS